MRFTSREERGIPTLLLRTWLELGEEESASREKLAAEKHNELFFRPTVCLPRPVNIVEGRP